VLGIREGDELEIILENDHITVRPRYPRVVAEFNLEGVKRLALGDSTVVLEAGEYLIERIDRSR
jgi:hypothetical protein